jgi:hypothetical protein
MPSFFKLHLVWVQSIYVFHTTLTLVLNDLLLQKVIGNLSWPTSCIHYWVLHNDKEVPRTRNVLFATP